ncbi:MAG: hypothetical protein R3D00_24340 [Bacteroidia bacterium]
MKYYLWLLAAALVLVGNGCKSSSPAPYSIEFCTSLGENDECMGKNDHFPPATRVFVKCVALEPFPYDYITGSIYEIRDGQKTGLIAQQSFPLKVQDTHVSYFLPFDDYNGKGEFLIEFAKPNTEVLVASHIYLEE